MNLPCQILSCNARSYEKSMYTVYMIFKHCGKRNYILDTLFPIINLEVAGWDTPPSKVRSAEQGLFSHEKMPANWFRCDEQKLD